MTTYRLVPDTGTNRQRIFQQLRAVEAYQASEVIQHWSVRYNRRTIQGKPEAGHVALKSDDTSLRIYFAEGSSGTPRCKRELVERLSSFCGFINATTTEFDRKYLLMNILDEDDLNEIEEMLDRERVPPLASDGDLAAEAERRRNAHENRQRSSGSVAPTNRTADIPTSRIGNLRIFAARDWDPSASFDGDGIIFPQGSPCSNAGAGNSRDVPELPNVRLFSFARGSTARRLGATEPDERTASVGEIFVSFQKFFMLSLQINI